MTAPDVPATGTEPAHELPHEHDCAYGPGGYHRFKCYETACVYRLFLDCPDRKDHP